MSIIARPIKNKNAKGVTIFYSNVYSVQLTYLDYGCSDVEVIACHSKQCVCCLHLHLYRFSSNAKGTFSSCHTWLWRGSDTSTEKGVKLRKGGIKMKVADGTIGNFAFPDVLVQLPEVPAEWLMILTPLHKS